MKIVGTPRRTRHRPPPGSRRGSGGRRSTARGRARGGSRGSTGRGGGTPSDEPLEGPWVGRRRPRPGVGHAACRRGTGRPGGGSAGPGRPAPGPGGRSASRPPSGDRDERRLREAAGEPRGGEEQPRLRTRWPMLPRPPSAGAIRSRLGGPEVGLGRARRPLVVRAGAPRDSAGASRGVTSGRPAARRARVGEHRRRAGRELRASASVGGQIGLKLYHCSGAVPMFASSESAIAWVARWRSAGAATRPR